jgi:hypothetical protein
VLGRHKYMITISEITPITISGENAINGRRTPRNAKLAPPSGKFETSDINSKNKWIKGAKT